MSACRICFRKVGSISHKGKEVILIGNGLCKQCYDKDYKSRLSNTCKTCGGELIKPSARPVCRLCKKVKMEEYRYWSY
jgi:hypothetical protein